MDGARDYVRRQVSALARRCPERVSSARVKLAVVARLSVRRPALAQANLEVDGHLIRVQVTAAFVEEAGCLVRTRLGEQIARLAAPSLPRAWPERTERRARPEPLARPAAERGIARRKSCPLARCAPDQAALTMDLMDYDVHLFIDTDTGQDSVLYRTGPTGY